MLFRSQPTLVITWPTFHHTQFLLISSQGGEPGPFFLLYLFAASFFSSWPPPPRTTFFNPRLHELRPPALMGVARCCMGMELPRWGRGDVGGHGLEPVNGDVTYTPLFCWNQLYRELQPAPLGSWNQPFQSSDDTCQHCGELQLARRRASVWPPFFGSDCFCYN